MVADSARVLPLWPDQKAVSSEDEPFVETSLARALCVRMEAIHERQAIGVFAGPWGIGKTRTIHAFAKAQGSGVLVLNVEPGANNKGRSPVAAMQLIAEALLRRQGYWSHGSTLPSSQHALSKIIAERIWLASYDSGGSAKITFVFDEAQNLSRSAIEMLRFWNDREQNTLPRPVGLIFVGNQEFALEEDATGQSVISGAVRSRARFIGSFSYEDLTRDDIELIVRSRGIVDPAAIGDIADYFSRPRIRRDLRQLGRIIEDCRLRADGGAVTGEIARKCLFGR